LFVIIARNSLGEKVRPFIRNVDDPETLLDILLHGSPLHVFRATDPNLTLRSMNGLFREEDCAVDIQACTEPLVGTRAQLAKIVMASGIDWNGANS